MCYHFGYFLFTGQTLLCNKLGATTGEQAECGRVESMMRSREQMKASIKQKLFVLDKETMVLPGSGEFTSVATEMLYNPEVGENQKKCSVCSHPPLLIASFACPVPTPTISLSGLDGSNIERVRQRKGGEVSRLCHRRIPIPD